MVSITTLVFLCVNILVAFVLQGCGSSGGGSGGSSSVNSCGTKGAGTQYAVNDFHHKCSNCGYQPCYSGGMCYSCHGVDQKCYKYDCGKTCSNSPCPAVPHPKPSSNTANCGTKTGGVVPAVNNPIYSCSNCGHRPCVAQYEFYNCYSCLGIDDQCYMYDCGTHCSNTPCPSAPPASTCGVTGYGDQPCINNNGYTCYNCGPAPCVDTKGTCYSCYSPQDQKCYPYHCGYTCSTKPCGAEGAMTALAGDFAVDGMVPKMMPGNHLSNATVSMLAVPAAMSMNSATKLSNGSSVPLDKTISTSQDQVVV